MYIQWRPSTFDLLIIFFKIIFNYLSRWVSYCQFLREILGGLLFKFWLWLLILFLNNSFLNLCGGVDFILWYTFLLWIWLLYRLQLDFVGFILKKFLCCFLSFFFFYKICWVFLFFCLILYLVHPCFQKWTFLLNQIFFYIDDLFNFFHFISNSRFNTLNILLYFNLS